MNITPISFGKTVKINASEMAAHAAANLINNQRVEKGNERVQRELKQIFNDVTPRGDAYVYTVQKDKETFILTGADTEQASKLYEEMFDEIEEIGSYYGSGNLFDEYSNEAVESFHERMRSWINLTREDYEISFDFDERKSKIRSVEIIG